MSSYSLEAEPWISVAGPLGSERLGIRDALVRAHEVRLAFADKLQEVAVIRFLLAMVIDMFGLPEHSDVWAERWRKRQFDAALVADYLDQFDDRFDLLGPQPAFQVADLTALSGDTKPSSLLVPSIATGNNVPLFSARLEDNPPPLTLADAALAIIATQGWDTAAIKTGAVGDPRASAGKTTGNPTGPLGQLGVVIPTGPTLFHTLLLNMPTAHLVGRVGTPWWRRPPETAAWSERNPNGLLDLLTWQSRRILIFPEQGTDGVPVVRKVLVCAGDRLASVPDAAEIHTVWRAVKNPKAGEPASRPVRHQSGRQLWRGMAGLLAFGGASSDEGLQTATVLRHVADLDSSIIGGDFPLGVLGVGVEYGNQSAVVENVYVDEIPLPIAALGRDSPVAEAIRECSRQADELRMALNTLGDNVRRAAGGDAIPWDKSQRPGDRMVAEFDGPIRRVLGGLQTHPEKSMEAIAAWAETARVIAHRAGSPVIAAAAASGFLGRGEGKDFISVPLADNFYRGRIRAVLGTSPDKERSA